VLLEREAMSEVQLRGRDNGLRVTGQQVRQGAGVEIPRTGFIGSQDLQRFA
jgi:hypothetical protein